MKKTVDLATELFRQFIYAVDEKAPIGEFVFSEIKRIRFVVASFRYPSPQLVKGFPGVNWNMRYSKETFGLSTMYDFLNKKKKVPQIFLFAMCGSFRSTTQCSLHVSDTPRLRSDTRPPLIASLDVGKKTKNNFFIPRLKYTECNVATEYIEVVNLFRNIYLRLWQSGEYSRECDDLENGQKVPLLVPLYYTSFLPKE